MEDINIILKRLEEKIHNNNIMLETLQSRVEKTEKKLSLVVDLIETTEEEKGQEARKRRDFFMSSSDFPRQDCRLSLVCCMCRINVNFYIYDYMQDFNRYPLPNELYIKGWRIYARGGGGYKYICTRCCECLSMP